MALNNNDLITREISIEDTSTLYLPLQPFKVFQVEFEKYVDEGISIRFKEQYQRTHINAL